MKRSEQLKIARSEKVTRMEAILAAAKDGEKERKLSKEERTEFDALKSEVTELDSQITDAEFIEARQASTATDATQHQRNSGAPQQMRKASNIYSISRAIRCYNENGKLDGLEGETQSELQNILGIRSRGILIPTAPLFKRANENTTSTHAAVLDAFVHPDVSIFGKEPLYEKMGATIIDGAHGSIKLSKKAPNIGQQVAEAAALSNNSTNPATGDTLTPKRYGDTDVWTAELMAQQNPAIHAKLMSDLLKGCDRKITTDVYTHILAGATAVATGALTEAGLNALMNQVDGEGAFVMSRTSFYAGKIVKFDTGSGLRLLNAKSAGIGETWEGVPVFYSSLFSDGAAQQYVAYGDMSELFIVRWGAVEVLFDPYTLSPNGETRVTVNRLADMGVRNDAAFAKSPDLDSAT